MGQNQVVWDIHFLTSFEMSEQTNERNGAKWAVQGNWLNGASKQANGRAGGPVLIFGYMTLLNHSAVTQAPNEPIA